MKKAFSLTIHGKVQGVFYRENAVKKAQELGICGFVKNIEDSTVLCVIEGEELKLQEYITWCYEGSKSAKVEKIDIKEIENENFSNFSISY